MRACITSQLNLGLPHGLSDLQHSSFTNDSAGDVQSMAGDVRASDTPQHPPSQEAASNQPRAAVPQSPLEGMPGMSDIASRFDKKSETPAQFFAGPLKAQAHPPDAAVTEKQHKIVTAHELSQRNTAEEGHDFSLYLADAQSHKAMQLAVAMQASVLMIGGFCNLTAIRRRVLQWYAAPAPLDLASAPSRNTRVFLVVCDDVTSVDEPTPVDTAVHNDGDDGVHLNDAGGAVALATAGLLLYQLLQVSPGR
jgi:hypothetical protein